MRIALEFSERSSKILREQHIGQKLILLPRFGKDRRGTVGINEITSIERNIAVLLGASMEKITMGARR